MTTLRANLQHNNFDVIRLFAAIMVIASHSYFLLGRPEPVAGLLGYETAGSIGVAIFFCMSGFLVTRSAERGNLNRFLDARIRRLVPALFVACMLDVFVVGAFFTNLPFSEYIRDRTTITHLFGWTVFGETPFLSGVFGNSPYPNIVNGSLWTLPIEATMYLILAVMITFGLVKRPILVGLAIAACSLCIAVHYIWPNSANPPGTPTLLANVQMFSFAVDATFFFIGSMFYLFRDHIQYQHAAAALAVLLLVLSAKLPLGLPIACVAFPYLAFYVAFRLPVVVDVRARFGDLSYGLYVYSFPIQQSLLALIGHKMPATVLTLMVIAISAPLAYLSWHLVERPMLRGRSSVVSTTDRPS